MRFEILLLGIDMHPNPNSERCRVAIFSVRCKKDRHDVVRILAKPNGSDLDRIPKIIYYTFYQVLGLQRC